MGKKHTFWRTLFAAISLIISATALGHEYHFKVIDKSFDKIGQQLYDLDFDNRRESVSPALLDKLDQMAKASGNSQLQARALYWRVRMGQMSAQPRKCIETLEKAIRLCTDSYDYDRACISYQLSGNYERMGEYLKSYNLLTTTFDIFRAHGDNFYLGNAYLLLAQMFSDINDEENAKEVLKEAKEAYQAAAYPLNRIYFFEAMMADDAHKLPLYKRSLETGGMRDWGMTIQAMSNISQIFLKQNKVDSAYVYSRGALDMLEKTSPDNHFFRSLLNVYYVHVLYAKGDYETALALLKQEEAKSEILRGERVLGDIYEYLWKVSEKLGRKDDAHRYLTLYMKEYKRIGEEVRRQDIPKARAREAIARRNDTIQLLEKDAQISRNVMYLVIMVAVVLVLVAGFLFFYFYQRYKIRKMENRELRNHLRQEALIYSVNRKNFEEDIKQKECEISSNTLLLANKNEVLQQISDVANRYLEEGKVPLEFVKQVNAVIGDSLKNDDEWQRFKLHFDSVHPDFFVHLKTTSSELTENDLRLCAYIRIGMRAKQIAEMLSVSSDSINSNRYRLRKKFGLQRGESLDDFIRKI